MGVEIVDAEFHKVEYLVNQFRINKTSLYKNFRSVVACFATLRFSRVDQINSGCFPFVDIS